MSPDPFRRLDGIDPPDQWDAIAERAARSGPDDLDVDLDGDPAGGRARRRTGGLVAAAAALVLLGGTVIALQAGDDGAEDVAAATSDPAAEPGGAGGGDSGERCPFHLDPGSGFPALVPGTAADVGWDLDEVGATLRHGVVGDRRAQLLVGGDLPEVVGSDEGQLATYRATETDGATSIWVLVGGELTEEQRASASSTDCDGAMVLVDGTDLLAAGEAADEEAQHQTLAGRADPLRVLAVDLLAAIRLDPPATADEDEEQAQRQAELEAQVAAEQAELRRRMEEQARAQEECRRAQAEGAAVVCDMGSPTTTAPGSATTETTAPPTTTTPATPGAGQPVAPATPSGAPQSWEHTLPDGRTYRVETGGGRIKGFVDGRPIGDSSLAEMDASGGFGFEITPNPDGGPQDWVIVGARPAGTARTVVVGLDGEAASPTLTVSPDGSYWAIHGFDPSLAHLEATPGPWPVTHYDAAGEVIAVVDPDG